MLFPSDIMNFIGKLSQNIITSEISKNGGVKNSKVQPSIKATKKWQNCHNQLSWDSGN